MSQSQGNAKPVPPDEANTATTDEIKTAYEKNKDISGLNFQDGTYASSTLELKNARLDGANLFRANFNNLDMSGASLLGVKAERMVCIGTNFYGADFRHAVLDGADFTSADLRNADLRGASTSGMKLNGAKVKGMKIDRHGLLSLGQSCGGLSDADKAALEVEDDKLNLALSFGGFWTFLHMLAAAIFIAPYAVFGVTRFIAAKTVDCNVATACEPLRDALIHYIISGGTGDGFDGFSLTIFFMLLSFHGLRLALVYKLNRLDLTEMTTGLPQIFVLEGIWYWLYHSCQILKWVNFPLVLLNAYMFMDTAVPKLV